MQKLLKRLDENLLSLFAGFLLVFIPLYPKLPLFDIIPGYIVRVRLEDFLVLFANLVFFVYFIRRKIEVKDILAIPTVKWIFFYLIIGFFSILTGVFIIKTIPPEIAHWGKSILHFFRRIEYFSLFFLLFYSIKNIRQVKIYLILLALTTLGVSLYGCGQKYLYWPAFSTMNREFSKGFTLYLSEHARVLSTFGGHYDLAAYLVIVLPIALSFLILIKNRWWKILFGVVASSSFWLLILTASRISFGSYLIAASAVVFFLAGKFDFFWGVKRWFAVIFLSLLIMLSFGDLSERFLKLFKLDQKVGGLKSLVLRPVAAPPAGKAVFLENNISSVTSRSDTPPSLIKPDSGFKDEVPFDVDTENTPPLLIPKIDEEGNTVLVEKPRTYSENARKFDLSTGIRLDALWPMAIRGFLKNPFMGSGYATLNKTYFYERTEAESTDNDYLRALGETGLLGFITFFGSILLLIGFVFKNLAGIRDNFVYALSSGFLAGTIGLLFNAFYIDVFEASKVAFSFWAIAGITAKAVTLAPKEEEMVFFKIPFGKERFLKSFKEIFLRDRFWMFFLIIIFISLRFYKINEPLADWHSWRQADTAAVTRNYLRYGVDLLRPRFDDLSSVASGKDNPEGFRFVEFPIYNLAGVYVREFTNELTEVGSFRFTSILFSLSSLIFLFLIVRNLLGRRLAYLSALVFTLLPYNIFYSRVVLPEPAMLATSLGAIYFLIMAKSKEQRAKMFSLFISGAFFSISILIKPYAIFLLLPMTHLWFKDGGLGKLGRLRETLGWLVFIILTLLPFIFWRIWMRQYPEGIPASDWLFNGDGIRFKGAWFYWIFADRIGRLILGYWGLLPFGLGLILKNQKKEGGFFFSWLAGILAYLTVFATGNVRHDYYQVLAIPILTIFIAKGLNFLLFEKNPPFNGYLAKFAGIVSFVFMIAFGWYFVKDYFNINHPEIVEAGKEVEKITGEEDLVIAPYDGDTAFLYQTGRRGWPLISASVYDLVKKGATHLVVLSSLDELNAPDGKEYKLGVRNKVLKQTDKYIIYRVFLEGQKIPL